MTSTPRLIGRHLLLAVLSLLTLAPFAWMLTTSLKSIDQVNKAPYLLPRQFEVGNYSKALTAAPFAHYYLNSVVMTAGIVVGHLVCDTLAAYALARLRFPGRDAIFLGLVATMLVPAFLTVLPAFDLVIRFGWYNSYAALILPRLADVFGIVVLRGFMKSLPQELDEAARIDGANRMQILTRILLPLCKPALASVAVFSFLFAWNDFLWPLLVTNDDQYRTVQIGLSVFTNKYGPWPNYLMAGTVIAAAPAIALFLYLQRGIVRGLASTGVKE
ncbi:carbohydrate ABC transporter permease [Phycicoccus sp. 3266]|uniref:carbohydrate ABC transporter permease n=1 Tax=Phycicoccus sp. 3266 TaxID=2817751 RepID=UPI002855783A|nr:carbohydrate ABC transporter permease [Phycicoccus sp. 3266]MDR6862831.1 multiple sugar transport system permease protein [Phycicoccus sp. 3266]